MVDLMPDDLERGRAFFEQRAWTDAHGSLARADRGAALAAEDLELLATAAYMVGCDEEQQSALERAHRAYLDRGEPLAAVRSAFWLGVHLLLHRDTARATGWFARAQRVLEHEEADCVEQGYMLVAADLQETVSGDSAAAYAAAAAAAEVAERFGDSDLLALALMDQGRHLVRLGRVREGLERLDEAMVEATSGELSPIVTGLVYCSVIDGCQEVYELRRANEWTTALSEWCDRQPGLVPFTGTCLMHRAELMQLRGEWSVALEEARLARERFAQRSNDAAAGEAFYRQGEILRLQGDLAGAEQAYRAASRSGREPQPGFALLRLAQRRTEAATAAVEQVLAATTGWVERARLLPAAVEIMLAAGDREQARTMSAELDGIATCHGSAMLQAQAAQARGAVELADGDPRSAVHDLRQAWKLWQQLEAPYEDARARLLIAQACSALGDDETAALERDAARAVLDAAGSSARGGRNRRLDPTRAPGAAAGRGRPEQQGDRRGAGGQQAHRRQAREQHLRQVPRLVASRGHRLRVRARVDLSAHWVEIPTWAQPRIGSFGRSDHPRSGGTVEPNSTKRRNPMATKLETDARHALLTGIPVEERRLQLAGISTSVLEGGDGPPLLLLHGPGGYGALWQTVIPALTTSHRVIAPDLPGHGSSPVDNAPLEAHRVLDWLGELIEETCEVPPVVVGQLVGGAIAARFAAERSAALDRLVLVVPFGLASFEPSPAFGAALTGFLTAPGEGTHDELWKHCVFDFDRLRARPETRWELLKAYNLDRAADGRVSSAIRALIGQFGFPAIPDELLRRIAVPTSLIWGAHDSIVPLSVGQQASERFGWPLDVIERAGNEPALEAPEEFVRALRRAEGVS